MAFAVATYAMRLPEAQRDRFALFAHFSPADALTGFLREQEGRKGDLPACPGWFWARPR